MNALLSTQIDVTLSLNIVTTTDGETQLMTLPLVQLTTLIFWLWTMGETITDIGFELWLIVAEVGQVVSVVWKIFSITLNALAFGLGINL